MPGTTLGTAYVQIMPSAQGIKGSITNVLGGEAESAGTAVGGKIGAFAKKAIIAAGIGTVVAKTAKAALAQGAELEQNIGGAYAVFGDKLYGTLEKQAQSAYRNMGLSASDYYATANKMGSLFQGSGLSQQKSLDLTTKAMQRAADVASVMGIDTSMAMESIAGAAKGNFTMMDNLGVAMNATTLEAYALEKGLNFKWNTASNAEKAELAMQMFMDRTSQYAGNFEREASQTISGSIGMMQSAWQSLVAGIGNGNADIGKLMANLGESLKAVAANVVPVIQQIAAHIPEMLTSLIQMVMDSLPMFMETASTLVQGIVQTLITSAPMLINGAAALITQLADGLTNNMDQVINTTITLIGVIGNAIINNLPKIIEAGIKLIGALVKGLLNAIPRIVAAIPRIISSIRSAFSNVDWGEIGRNIIQGIAQGLKNAGRAIMDAAKEAARNALDAAKNFLGINSPSKVFRDEVGKNMALGMAEGFADFPKKQIGRAAAGITAAAAGTSVSYGGTTVNVYAQPGQSVQAIADAVANRINQQVNQRINAWATN